MRAQSWALVKVDNETWGQTPIQRRRIPAGKHKVVVINDSQGREETRHIDVQPGEHETVSIDW